MTIEKNGQNFKPDVSQVQALNFKLSVGNQATSVTVTDAVPLVQTANSQTGAVINDRQLTDLPLNGRLGTGPDAVSTARTCFATRPSANVAS